MPVLDLANITLPEILLWLLTYAIVYGILSQVGDGGIPKSKAARSIIAIVAGFLVLMSQPAEILAVLSQMAGDMLLVIIGILVLVVFVEMAGVKLGGTKITAHKHVSRILFLAFVVIAVAIFISAGGLRLLGWEGRIFNIDWNTLLFLIVIIGAIWWMISESEGQQRGG